MTVATADSPVAAVEIALGRVSALDPAIRAFVHVDADGARRRAASLERQERRRRGTLFGFTLGVKDLIDTRDMPTAYGSPIFAGNQPARDAKVVQRMRRAGGVVIGKTVTTEFATFDPPLTRNPWNLACTPGGSSSGSAAAVASGMVRAAIGTQTAGSVLRPASYCGVVGFMPSPGWIGRTGIFPCAISLDRVGLLARSVSDARQLLDASVGVDSADPASIRRPRRDEPPVASPDELRIGVIVPLLERATPSMASTVRSVTERMADNRVSMSHIVPSETFNAGIEGLHTMMRAEIAVVHKDLYRQHRRSYGSRIASIIKAGLRTPATDYIAAQQTRRRFRAELDRLLEDLDALLAPAAVGAAEPSLDTIGDPLMNIPATYAGLPAICLPAELSDDGLPLGIQLIGRRNDDDRLLEIARWLEGILAFQARPQLAGAG